MLRSETSDSGFRGSDSDLSRPQSYNCQDTVTMKDLLNLSKIMNENVLVEEEPMRNGIKNIELTDLTKLGYERVPAGENGKEMMIRRSETSSMTSASSQSDDIAVNTEYMQMKKGVGLLSGVALIVGTMIGSGIFISPKGVLQSTGSVALSLIVWAGCGLVALLGI